MAKQRVDGVGLTAMSFQSSQPGRSRPLAVLICLSLALAAFAAVVMRHQKGAASSLTDTNSYESTDAYDAEWDQTQLQQHLVRTQRMMTTENKHMDNEVKRLDNDVEDLMKMLAARPAGPSGPQGGQGSPGPEGKAGSEGAAGAPGDAGKAGVDGRAGPDGKDGPAGAVGLRGEDGRPGQQGETGDVGPRGAQGTPGLPGMQGQAGVPGAPGMVGMPGMRGPVAGIHAEHHYTSSSDYWSEPAKLASRASSVKSSHSRLALLKDLLDKSSARSGYERLTRIPWERKGNIRIAQLPAGHRKYELEITGPRGDRLRATVRGEDGFSRSWKGRSFVETQALREAPKGSHDFLKVSDETSGRSKFFRIK